MEWFKSTGRPNPTRILAAINKRNHSFLEYSPAVRNRPAHQSGQWSGGANKGSCFWLLETAMSNPGTLTRWQQGHDRGDRVPALPPHTRNDKHTHTRHREWA